MSGHTAGRPRDESDQLAVNRSARGADRNRDLASNGDPTGEDVFLPSPEPGITLLGVDGSRGVPVLRRSSSTISS